MPAFTNSYAPPAPPDIPSDIHLHTPPDEYDFNYVFEVKQLRSDRVELRPMVPSLHAKVYFEGVNKYPEVLKWMGISPPRTLEETLVLIEKIWRAPTDSLSYAIFTEPPGSTTKVEPEDYVYAGSIAIINSSSPQMIAEPGYVTILPPFHVHAYPRSPLTSLTPGHSEPTSKPTQPACSSIASSIILTRAASASDAVSG
ncbi:hypothetical protein, variant 1 [Cryptococcus amylolentus CBS 6039]|uniref:Uncharacterized protein n=1 Tax=Cryptococcus amylolentus CBS 6039 TaxID=1295533 RepID=A0A1E3I1F4_9TREE|nr:hypothetical protein, variant 1 [Cryptococcus amylolentus CBS 6039]ODN81796.1 hypothetical protein, variant 1 [Cryptococcus amylolentus CBS 6039]